jgi:glutamate racemase
MGPEVMLVSSADETALAVRDLLGAPSEGSPGRLGDHRFVTSGDVETFGRLGARFLGPEVVHVEQWAWT